MDLHQLSTLRHSLGSLPSRRDLVRALSGAGLGVGALRFSNVAEAKKKKKKHGKKHKRTQSTPTASCTPNCTDRGCGNDGCGGSCGSCGANHFCQGGTCVCAESPAATCTDKACGSVATNVCGESVTCPCSSAEQCLSNGSCAIVCDQSTTCPSHCGGCSGRASTEGAFHCIKGLLPTQTPCTSTAGCPRGTHCQDITGTMSLCVPLCT